MFDMINNEAVCKMNFNKDKGIYSYIPFLLKKKILNI